MLMYPALNPVALHVGSWPIYWYGVMYLVGFVSGWLLLSQRIRYHSPAFFSQEDVSDIVFYVALGAIVGGRLGYVLFYDFPMFIHTPWVVFKTWQGGMSFHGGLIGVLVAMLLYGRKTKRPFLRLTDFIAPVVPIGLGAGRIGNFINGELWGRVTEVPWGMIYPHVDEMPRHPSQLYEFMLEGVLLFTILWLFSRKSRPVGAVSGLFALCYGTFRIFAECFREPDIQIGYLAYGYLTEGQLLSLPLVLIGTILLVRAYRR